MKKIVVPIRGMHCRSCEILIGTALEKLPGVNKVSVDYRDKKADVFFKETAPSSEEISSAVREAGYEVGETGSSAWLSTDGASYRDLVFAAAILGVIYFAAQRFGLFDLGLDTTSTNPFIGLLIGLVAGVSTCMALVGGLVLGISARHAELHPEASALQKFRPHLYFNLGRILGFGLLGGLIGLLGSVLTPSVRLMGMLTAVVGLVMVFLGLKLVDIFPKLKNVSITLPSGIAKKLGIHKDQREYSHSWSMLAGALTFFLPCGFTQAMQLYAVSTGSFVQGALAMSLFALGTAPGLLGVGGLSSIFKGQKARVFFATVGLAVIAMGFINISNGGRLAFAFKPNNSPVTNAVTDNGDYQEVRMSQLFNGYSPNVFNIKSGKQVKWIIDSKTQFSCASSIVVPSLGISKNLSAGENIIIFTPTQAGEIPFSCSMNMYRGKFVVTDGKSAANTSSENALAANGTQSIRGSACGGNGGGCGGAIPFSETAGDTAKINSAGSETQVIKAVYTQASDIRPNSFTVKVGTPVRLEIDVRDDGFGCMSSIHVPGLYDRVELLRREQPIIMSFTPQQAGDFPITCAMGMYRGSIKVEQI